MVEFKIYVYFNIEQQQQTMFQNKCLINSHADRAYALQCHICALQHLSLALGHMRCGLGEATIDKYFSNNLCCQMVIKGPSINFDAGISGGP